MALRIVGAVAAIALMAACGRAGGASSLVVSAAVSLTEAVQEVSARYHAATGVQVRVNTGPSNTLARQILDGAAVDVFLSADEAQMDVVERGGRIEPGSRVALLGNQLVIVVSRGAGLGLRGPQDLLDPRIRRITLGDPTAVPAGVYARRYLESAGLWTALQPKLVPTVSVRAALAAVASADADAGFVYRTDASRAEVDVAFVVPADPVTPIVYPAAIVKGSRHVEDARRFVAYLDAGEARAIFEAAGFTPLRR
jgi:molybdate transport system substrate-binding protein